MEFVDGCNLKALLESLHKKNRRIDIAQTIYIALECCKALNYAHNIENPENMQPLHIVHRDVSPPNILLSKMGEIKLVDFGLAKANSQIESTDPGVVKGKFSYLSPEAACGNEVDHRADIFAMGIILWELLTGRRLFYGDTDYQTVEQVRKARVPSIATVNPEIEEELEAIVQKALEREPEKRFQHAADLGDALAQYLFSRRMKVTARDIAASVREAQSDTRNRIKQNESLIDALIQEEMGRITSLFDEDKGQSKGKNQGGAAILDPKEFVDTSLWASEFSADETPRAETRTTLPLPTKSAERKTQGEPSEIQSLQQILEPDRSGLIKGSEPSKALLGGLIAVVFLLAAAAVYLFLNQ